MFSGEAIDLDSFCGNIISECEKTEEVLLNNWFKEMTAVFKGGKPPRTERQFKFYKCASSLISIQVTLFSNLFP